MVHKYVRKLRSLYKVQRNRVLWHRKMFMMYYVNKSRIQKHLCFRLAFLTWNGKREHVESESKWQRDQEAERRKYTGKVKRFCFAGGLSLSLFFSSLCSNCLQSTRIHYFLIFKEFFFRPKNVYVGEGKIKTVQRLRKACWRPKQNLSPFQSGMCGCFQKRVSWGNSLGIE